MKEAEELEKQYNEVSKNIKNMSAEELQRSFDLYFLKGETDEPTMILPGIRDIPKQNNSKGLLPPKRKKT